MIGVKDFDSYLDNLNLMIPNSGPFLHITLVFSVLQLLMSALKCTLKTMQTRK